jgi:hypothetical protein
MKNPSVSQAIDSLLGKWNRERVTIGRPNSLEKIQRFEENHRVRIPEDFRSYLLAANGTGDSDSNGYWFWPLEQIRSALDDLKTHSSYTNVVLNPKLAQFFIFADYLQWSWAFAFRFSEGDAATSDVFRVDGDHLVLRVAGSFGEFVGLYLADSHQLYEPDKHSYI